MRYKLAPLALASSLAGISMGGTLAPRPGSVPQCIGSRGLAKPASRIDLPKPEDCKELYFDQIIVSGGTALKLTVL